MTETVSFGFATYKMFLVVGLAEFRQHYFQYLSRGYYGTPLKISLLASHILVGTHFQLTQRGPKSVMTLIRFRRSLSFDARGMIGHHPQTENGWSLQAE